MLRRFRRLQWRMTCSYILLTIPAIVLMQACFLVIMGFAFYAFINSQALAEEQATALTVAAPQAVPFLTGPSPDSAGLAEWLRGTMCCGAQQPTMFPPNMYPVVHMTAVVDSAGRVVAGAGDTLAAGMLLADQLDAQANTVLRAALQGQTAPQALAVRQADNGVVAAAPIKNGQQVVGAWLVDIGATPMPTRSEAWFFWLVFLIPLSILAALFAAGLGALYGSFTSRSLVRRLRSLASAAGAWSAGDFSAAAPDRSPDELGQLSSRLNRMAQQLQALVATRQELATLEERNRLARDLHDSVKQQLFAISMQLASARTLVGSAPPVDALLAHAETLTQAAQRELTATIYALRPATLPAGGIGEALGVYVAQWSRQHAIAAELHSHGHGELPPASAQALFRVAQEALANVARHSCAGEVTLQLGIDRQAVTLAISDNGHGFTAEAPNQGIGLHSMRERVTAHGGTLVIDSRPGAGTRIVARLPIGGGRRD